MESNTWTTPVEVSELNSKGTDCCTTFDKDDLTMIFVSNRGGAGDLFISTRAKVDDPWGKPTALAAINTAVRDTNPWLGPQGRLLMFASDRPGTSGDLDIWIVDLLAAQSDGGVAPLAGTALATPLPLPGINSAYPDQDPWLSPDGKTLYFASSRGGSSDIYRARLIE